MFDPSASRSGAVFSDVPNYEGAWIVYINGRKVSTIGFDVDYGVWQIPTFRIHLVPDVTIQRLGTEDRVPVQIFYLDSWANDTPTFRLLVDGEIIGWSFSSTSAGRSIAFSCIAHIHIFQQLYFFYMTNVDDIVASRSPEVIAQGFSTPGLLYPYAIFHQGLMTTAAQATEATPQEAAENDQNNANGNTATPAAASTNGASGDASDEATALINTGYELVTNVIKGVISQLVPNDRRAVPMMNFFARHIRKTRFHNRWVRLPIFEDGASQAGRVGVFPIFNAVRNDQALLAMQREMVSQIGNSGPVWNLFQQILGLVYMDIAMIPNPACVQVTLEPTGEGVAEEGKILGLMSDTATVTTRRGVDPVLIRGRAETVADFIRRDLTSSGPYRTGPYQEYLDEAGFTTSPLSVSEVNTDEIYSRMLQRANAAAAAAGHTDETTMNPLKPIRLAQYAVKPQFLFGEVPACNVILPSMVDSFSYDESYIQQPTRVYVNDSVMTRLLRSQGSNREFMLHALTVAYPEEADAVLHHHIGSATEQDSATPGATESGRNLLIPFEEYYKGPVTARVALPSWFQMLQQFRNRTQESTDETPNSPQGGAATQTAPNNVPITTRTVEVPRSNTYVNNDATSNGPTPAPATVAPVADATQATYASRVQFGNLSRLSLNGARAARFWLRTGGGLDPANYVEARQTALWPIVPRHPPRRGRGGAPVQRDQRNVQQKMAQMMRVFLPICRQALGGLNPDQLFTATFGIYWVSFNEQGVTGYVSWALGNAKQYDNSPVGPWTINPWDRQPYKAAHSVQEAAAIHVNTLLRNGNFAMGIRAMLTGRGSADFNGYIDSRGYAVNPVWNRVAPIRPDLLYIALGYVGYYGTEHQPDPKLRGDIGFGKTRRMLYWHNLVKRLFDTNAIPPDVLVSQPYAGAHYRPLLREEDRPLLNWGRPRARETVVSRRLPRIQGVAQVALPGTAQANQQQPNRSTVAAAPAPQTVAAPATGDTSNAQENTEGDSFAQLFRLYAQYEYLKQRYSQRVAAVQMRFNPYLVPGFPAMLFDSMRTRMHVVGYVQTLHHEGFVSGQGSRMGTSTQLTFCRTLPEFINDVANDANRFAGRVTSAPAEIIDEIRVIIQDEDRAEEFYQMFLYGGPRPGNVPAVFRWYRAMGYARGINVENIEITGETVENSTARAQRAQAAVREQVNEGSSIGGAENTQANPATANASAQAGGVSSEGQQTVRHNLDPNEELAPNPSSVYADAFDNYHVAMQLAARPVCTLEQYIRFWHGGRTINDLQRRGDVGQTLMEFAYYTTNVNDVVGSGPDGTEIRTQTSRSTAQHYSHIFKLRVGPGPMPTDEQRGYTEPPGVQPTGNSMGLPADYPQTRADWDSVLDLYEQKIRNLRSPST